MFGFWDPLPLVQILDLSIVVNPRNLPYYVCFWTNPPSPLSPLCMVPNVCGTSKLLEIRAELSNWAEDSTGCTQI